MKMEGIEHLIDPRFRSASAEVLLKAIGKTPKDVASDPTVGNLDSLYPNEDIEQKLQSAMGRSVKRDERFSALAGELESLRD